MAEYINKEELMNEKPEWLNTSMWNTEKAEHNRGWNECNDEWIEIIRELPTIDIVTCGECMYWCGEDEEGGDCHDSADWFCADGER